MAQVVTREAVGVFRDIAKLNAAVAELEKTEFPRQDISVLAGDKEIEEEFGTSAIRPEYLEDNPHAPRTILIRPEEKVIGTAFIIGGGVYAGAVTLTLLAGGFTDLAAGAMAALVGGIGGGIIGAMIAGGLNWYYQRSLRNLVDKGGLILWVRTPGKRRGMLARSIMKKYGGRHVHSHDVV